MKSDSRIGVPRWAVLGLGLVLAFAGGSFAQEKGAAADPVKTGEEQVVPANEEPTEPAATEVKLEQIVEEKREPGSIWEWSRMTGDWGGARTKMEDAGVKLNLYYNHFYGILLNGGQDLNNAQRNSGTWDLHIFLDFEKMGLIPGGELFVWPKGHFSRNINTKVGALSDPFDDADGDKVVYIDVLQYQQTLLDKKLRLRLGYLDQQMAFDHNAYANSEDKQFFNTYLDNNNAIIPLKIGLGAVAFYDPTDWLGFTIGASDGDARVYRTGLDTTFHDGADFFGFFQTDFRIKLPSKNGDLPGNYRFGVLYDPGRKTVFLDTLEDTLATWTETGDVGYYVSFDQMVYRENPNDKQGLGAFFRWGTRDGDVNRISYFWSTGCQYEGLIPDRDKDVLGFGMYQVNSSHRYREEMNDQFVRETGYELYYQIQLTPWLTFTPDLQYIVTPGGLTTNTDAFVMGFRARVIF